MGAGLLRAKDGSFRMPSSLVLIPGLGFARVGLRLTSSAGFFWARAGVKRVFLGAAFAGFAALGAATFAFLGGILGDTGFLLMVVVCIYGVAWWIVKVVCDYSKEVAMRLWLNPAKQVDVAV